MFRENRTITYVVAELVENIIKATENDEYSTGIFIDFQKTFNTIDNSILLKTMEKYESRGAAYFRLRSYLENRDQNVEITNIISEFRKVTSGVPQGSVIGPKPFFFCFTLMICVM